jgi:hypothetical protein
VPLTLARLKYLDARGDDFEKQVKHLLEAIERVPIGESKPSESQPLKDPTPQLVQSRDLTQARRWFIGGAIPIDSDIYVERHPDGVIRDLLTSTGGVAVIWGPRQVGKSSMVIRAIARAKANGHPTAFVDFSGMGGANLSQFLYSLTYELSESLNVKPSAAARFLTGKLGPQIGFIKFLEKIPPRSVLVFDEIDYLRMIGELPNFFIALRAFCDSQSAFGSLKTFLLISSYLNPSRFTEGALTSPFNIGLSLRLSNFDLPQCEALLRKCGVKVPEDHVGRIYELTGGQPFLMQTSVRFLLEEGSIEQLEESSLSLHGYFWHHLNFLQRLVHQSPTARRILTRLRLRPTSLVTIEDDHSG